MAIRLIVSSRAKRGIGPFAACTPVFVYILASKTRRLYVGVTSNLIRRAWEHRTGVIAGFSRRYGITKLVYFESFVMASHAIRREKQIKSEVWFANGGRADSSLRSE